MSADHVAAFAGVGFLRGVEERLGRSVIADCGDDAGLVMAALRAGLATCCSPATERPRPGLAEMAEALGGRLRVGLDGRSLALEPGEHPTRRLEALVAEERRQRALATLERIWQAPVLDDRDHADMLYDENGLLK